MGTRKKRKKDQRHPGPEGTQKPSHPGASPPPGRHGSGGGGRFPHTSPTRRRFSTRRQPTPGHRHRPRGEVQGRSGPGRAPPDRPEPTPPATRRSQGPSGAHPGPPPAHRGRRGIRVRGSPSGEVGDEEGSPAASGGPSPRRGGTHSGEGGSVRERDEPHVVHIRQIEAPDHRVGGTAGGEEEIVRHRRSGVRDPDPQLLQGHPPRRPEGQADGITRGRHPTPHPCIHQKLKAIHAAGLECNPPRHPGG